MRTISLRMTSPAGAVPDACADGSTSPRSTGGAARGLCRASRLSRAFRADAAPGSCPSPPGDAAGHPSVGAAPTELLLQDVILLDQVFDDLGLLPVDPACERGEEQLKGEEGTELRSSHRAAISVLTSHSLRRRSAPDARRLLKVGARIRVTVRWIWGSRATRCRRRASLARRWTLW